MERLADVANARTLCKKGVTEGLFQRAEISIEV